MITSGIEVEFWEHFRQFCKDNNAFLRPGRVLVRGKYRYSILTGMPGIKIKLRVVEHLGCQIRISSPQSSMYFRELDPQRLQLESALDSGQGEIKWGHKERRVLRIGQSGKDTDLNARDKWPEYFAWLKERAESFHRVLVPRLKALRSEEEMETEEDDEVKE